VSRCHPRFTPRSITREKRLDAKCRSIFVSIVRVRVGGSNIYSRHHSPSFAIIRRGGRFLLSGRVHGSSTANHRASETPSTPLRSSFTSRVPAKRLLRSGYLIISRLVACRRKLVSDFRAALNAALRVADANAELRPSKEFLCAYAKRIVAHTRINLFLGSSHPAHARSLA